MMPSNKEVNKRQSSMYKVKKIVILDKFSRNKLCVDLIGPYNM